MVSMVFSGLKACDLCLIHISCQPSFALLGFVPILAKDPFPLSFTKSLSSLWYQILWYSLGIPFASIAVHGNYSLLDYRQIICDFMLTGGFWFLDALFLSTSIYMCIYRALRKNSLLISLLFLVIGCAMYYFHLPNSWNVQQALLLLPFIYMGQKLKSVTMKKQYEDIAIVLFILITICDLIFNIPLGGIMGKISLNLLWLPLLLVQSFCGTLFVIKLSKKIGKSYVLETVGKASLSIYVFHMYFLSKTLPLMRNITVGFFFGVAYVSFILLICVVVNKVLNTKYLKFVLGKF